MMVLTVPGRLPEGTVKVAVTTPVPFVVKWMLWEQSKTLYLEICFPHVYVWKKAAP